MIEETCLEEMIGREVYRSWIVAYWKRRMD